MMNNKHDIDELFNDKNESNHFQQAATTPYHNLVSSSIQDRIWMLQMAQREHALTKPPTNGIPMILPEPIPTYTFEDKDLESRSSTNPQDGLLDDYMKQQKRQSNALSEPLSPMCMMKKPPTSGVLCIVPRFLRKRKRIPADSSTVRLLDESSQGEWS